MDALCPRLHVDRVPLRLIVTYRGAGTLYASNSAVNRHRLVVPPEATGNDAAIYPGHHLHETGCGDVLLLKGDTWPGNQGKGWTHGCGDAAYVEKRKTENICIT